MYKLWIIIEDTDSGEEETMPLGIAERETVEECIEIREAINESFGEINPPLPKK